MAFVDCRVKRILFVQIDINLYETLAFCFGESYFSFVIKSIHFIGSPELAEEVL